MNTHKHIHQSWTSRLIKGSLIVAILLSLGTLLLSAQNPRQPVHKTVKPGPVEPPRIKTQPQHPPAGKSKPIKPPKGGKSDAFQLQSRPDQPLAALAADVPDHRADARDMRLLLIAADGQETDYPALKAFLDQIGIPYDTLLATETTLVESMLWDGVDRSYYQGIILTTGSLTYEASPGYWPSAFDDAEWETLWAYEAMFGVRQLTSYTAPFGYPDPYGLVLDPVEPYVDTTNEPLDAALTGAGAEVYPYLNASNPITFKNAWVYQAAVADPADTTPLLVTDEGHVIASIHTYDDGRQNLSITAANNPYLLHSMLLSYGSINWVTGGLFLGERHVNIAPQIDDLLIDDDMWDIEALSDTTGLTYRMSGDDYMATIAWQNAVRAAYPTAAELILEMVFNGEGASGIYSPDTLSPAVEQYHREFGWVNHTYSHANLDFITYGQALTELKENDQLAKKTFHLAHYFKDAFVQPDISGLDNPEFLRAASKFGIRYLISDTSREGWDNPSPNSGFYSTYEPRILIIPRRPSNLFYNLSTPEEFVSEYNCYYGPEGPCADGEWNYWDHDLTYEEILDKESDFWLGYLLKWDLDPLMFHQPNLRAYDGTHSLLGDLIEATLTKYEQVYNLPIRGLSEHRIGHLMAERMAYNASGVQASLLPCTSITLSVSDAATIPITGLAYGDSQETYGGQSISLIPLRRNRSLTIPAPACP